MERPPPAGTLPASALLRFAIPVATGLSVVYVLQQMWLETAQGLKPDPVLAFFQHLVPWYAWAVALPLIFRLCERFRLRWSVGRVAAYVAIGLVVGAVVTAVMLVPLHFLFGWAREGRPIWESFVYWYQPRIAGGLVNFGLLVAGCHSYLAHREAHERQLAGARLAAELGEARLRALQAQLEPHFLFNALNAVAAHLRREPDLAEAMVEELSSLLRMVLQHRGEAEATLEREISLIRSYLTIHQIRFGSRLGVRIRAREDLLDARVPVLLLQPLVENAIIHGVSVCPGPAWVRVDAREHQGALRLRVSNHGGAPGSPARPGSGVGLANIRARLAVLYGDAAALRVRQRRGATVVEARLPLRLPADARPAPPEKSR